MARVILQFEDTPEGKLKITSMPSFAEMGKLAKSGQSLSPAMVSAILILKRIHTEHKLMAAREKSHLILPRDTMV